MEFSDAGVHRGRAPATNPAEDLSFYDFVSAHFFEVIGNKVIRGRALDEQDTPNSHHVVQQTLADIDPNLTVRKMMTFEALVSGSFNSSRLMAQLTMMYGIVALVLASIGLYGVAAYTVARRTARLFSLGSRRVAEDQLFRTLRSVTRPLVWKPPFERPRGAANRSPAWLPSASASRITAPGN
jgi:hypothetical protein